MSEGLSSAPAPAGRVLFVDDDADVLKAAALLLERHGLTLTAARDPLEARSRMAAERVDVVLLDLNFARGATDGEEGFRCLRQLLADDPQAVVVVVTGHSGIAVAVRAMQAGAADFVMKPWNNARLLATVHDALELRRRRTARPTDDAPPGEAEPVILGESPAIERVRALVSRAGPTAASVLVLGEAGLGKSLVARRLHLASGRTGPFTTLDLAALSAEEAERALFGDRLGGARGALAETATGTLVLDEVADLAPAVQGRLAAALERLGAAGPRLVATSRRTRSELAGRAGLKDALLYRLNTVEILLPPLGERGRDAVLILEHQLRLFARRHGRACEPRLAPEAVEAVLAAPWPGGVRALQQAAERGVLFGEGEAVTAADLGLAADAVETPGAPTLTQSERTLVAAALRRHGFNVSHAARDLGLTRAALYRRMAKHGL